MAKRRKHRKFEVTSAISEEERAEEERHGIAIGRTREEAKAIRERWEKSLRWPLRGVTSEEFCELDEPDRLYRMSIGFLHSARSLCIELGEHPDRMTWPRGSVVYYALHIAVELFLKACLGKAGKRLPLHEISELQDEIDETFPPGCRVQTMFDINAVELAELGPEPGERRIPSREDQTFRYFSDRDGNLPPGSDGFSFAPAIMITMIEGLDGEFQRAWKLVCEYVSSTSR